MITPDFAAYAVKADVYSNEPISAQVVKASVERFMVEVTKECVDAGAYLIGHIKTIVETPEQGFLAASVTDPAAAPMTKDHLTGSVQEMDIIVNVLLYGLSRDKVQEIVDPIVLRHLAFPQAHVELEDLEKEHEHGDHEHEHDDEHEHDHC